MLGHGRKSSESSNAMDLGVCAPSYSDNPSRTIVRGRSIYLDRDDDRPSVLPKFKRTMKLKLPSDYKNNRSNMNLNADDDDDDDDNHSNPRTMSDVDLSDAEDGASSRRDRRLKNPPPSSPSLENARHFAQTLLAETERRRSERFNDEGSVRSSSSMQWPRRGRRNEFQGLRAPPQSSPEDMELAIGQLTREGILKTRIRRRRVAFRIILTLAALAMIVGFSILARRRNNTQSLQISEPERLSATMEALIGRKVTPRLFFQNQTSPQYKAARWIAMDDEEQLDIPMDSDADLDTNIYRFIQRYILAVLYFSWDGPNWTKRLNFLTSLHECSWYESMPDERGQLVALGVTCDERLQLRNLLIASNNLVGKIPPEIGHLTTLDFVNLNHNSLTGTIPPYLKQLSNLDYLDLKDNLFTGTIPSFMGELTRLEVLGLSHNQLTGRVPPSLGSLNLLTLAIDENILTGELSPVASMTKLQYLYAANNQFKGKLDGGLLANLTDLVEVDVSGNYLQASNIPDYLFSRPSLRVLDLHDNQITGTLPSAIPENHVLQYLSLRTNSIRSQIPSQINQLRKLTHLDLEDSAFTGTLPVRELAQMTSLSYLFLGKNPLQAGTIPSDLRTLTKLRELSLDSMQLTGTIPTWIENLSQLKLLDLRSNELMGSFALNITKLPELSYLLVSDNYLSGRIPESLGSRSNLFVVAFHHNNITGNAKQICETGIKLLTTDCEDVDCPCCKTCCDGASCYQDLLWDMLEYSRGLWEENFVRSNYAFNPQILYKDPKGGGEP